MAAAISAALFSDHVLWHFIQMYAIWLLALEIRICSIEYLEEERAFHDEWPWECDVLDRIAIDETAVVASP